MSSDHKSKPWYKKSHIWILVFISVLILAGIAGNDSSKTKTGTKAEPTAEVSTVAPTESKAEEPAKPKWDAAAIYDQIQAGMTKAQVEQIVGKASNDCTKSSIQGYGESEYCYYRGGFGDKGSISVSYHDGIVDTKSKIDF